MEQVLIPADGLHSFWKTGIALRFPQFFYPDVGAHVQQSHDLICRAAVYVTAFVVYFAGLLLLFIHDDAHAGGAEIGLTVQMSDDFFYERVLCVHMNNNASISVRCGGCCL